MSGLCGLVSNARRERASADMARMRQVMPHRAATFEDSFNSATGTSLAGTVVATDEQQQVVVAGDFRIDDADTLARRLGCDPKPTISHAQILLAAYGKWGADLNRHFTGDYALAIWDDARRSLVLSRDRMGSRPLYYRELTDGGIAFASEVLPLRRIPPFLSRLDELSVADHLCGVFPTGSATFFSGINLLPPGATLVWAEGRYRIREWEASLPAQLSYSDEQDYAADFLELFRRSVQERLSGSRPAILLSGGLDSMSIAAMVGSLDRSGDLPLSEPLRAVQFSYGRFPEIDERHLSQRIVAQYGFDSVDVAADVHLPLSHFKERRPHADDPFELIYDAVIRASIDRASDLGADTLIAGLRGDLLFGLNFYNPAHLIRHSQLGTLWRELRLQASWQQRSPLRFGIDLLRRYARELAEGTRILQQPLAIYRRRRNLPNIPWLSRNLAERSRPERRSLMHGIPASDLVIARRRRRALIEAAGPYHVVLHSERITRASGLRFVDPWSDMRLARFAQSVPQRVLNRPGDDKRLVRQAMHGLMDDEARVGAHKVSPHSAFVHALRHDHRAIVQELLTDMKSDEAGYVNADQARKSFAKFLGGAHLHPRFWELLTLERWLRLRAEPA